MLLTLYSLFLYLSFFVFFYSNTYFSEIILSFSPYILLLNLIFILFFLFFFVTKKIYRKNLLIFNFVLLLLSTYLFWMKYASFYTTNEQLLNTTENVKVFYSNIYYKNTAFDELESQIYQYDADVVMLVEFSKDHYAKLFEKLKEKYPYSTINSWSPIHAGDIVLSKYPLLNLASQVNEWKWRYSYFSFRKDQIPYYFYLVHTSAPVSLENYEMRNNQLSLLGHDFANHTLSRNGDNSHVVMVWDFNLSPWSFYYDSFSSKISDLNNVSSAFWFRNSWCLSYFPILCSHIDHVFVWNWTMVSSFENIAIAGSDHNWYFFTLNEY